MDLFTCLALGFMVALAYAVGEYVGKERRLPEITEVVLKNLEKDGVIKVIGDEVVPGDKK